MTVVSSPNDLNTHQASSYNSLINSSAFQQFATENFTNIAAGFAGAGGGIVTTAMTVYDLQGNQETIETEITVNSDGVPTEIRTAAAAAGITVSAVLSD